MKSIMFRHNTIFSEIGFLRGGVTLVPRYEMQASKHQDLPAKHTPTITIMRKS